MPSIYYGLITGKAINKKTGAEWAIDDVPKRWREATRELLEGGE